MGLEPHRLTPLTLDEIAELTVEQALARLRFISQSISGTSPDAQLREGAEEALQEAQALIAQAAHLGTRYQLIVSRGEFVVDKYGRQPVIGGSASHRYVHIYDQDGREIVYSSM